MTPRDLLMAVSVLSQVGVVALVLRRRGRRPLALPVSLFLLDVACMQIATMMSHATGAILFRGLDLVLTAMAPAFALHIVVAFVGASPKERRALQLSYVAATSLALLTSAYWWSATARRWAESTTWSAAFLLLWLLQASLMARRLWQHRRIAMLPLEHARTRLLQWALVA